MPVEAPCRHLLLVAAEERRAALRSLVDSDQWDVAEADCLEQAQFLLHVKACDAVVVDSSLAVADGSQGLAWLARKVPAPVVLVGDGDGASIVEALRRGALWLPEEALHRHPYVLGALLEQSIRLGVEREQAAAARAALSECEARIVRLLALLWEAAPGDGPSRWFTQRHMLERLDEEVARSQRYGAPLSVVLGELRSESGEKMRPDQAHHLATWLAERVGRYKRRCDVAGQYGLHGFMLLLPQSSTDQANEACKRLSGLLADPPNDDLPPVHACFGLASISTDLPTVPALLRRAEERLEEARTVPGATDTHDAAAGAR